VQQFLEWRSDKKHGKIVYVLWVGGTRSWQPQSDFLESHKDELAELYKEKESVVEKKKKSIKKRN
jgi:hypothetical protein